MPHRCTGSAIQTYRPLTAFLLAAFVLASIWLVGCDDDGLEARNRAPRVISVTCNPESVEIGQEVTVDVEAEDLDGDDLAYEYEVSGGTISGEDSTATWTTPDQAGEITVYVTIVDGRGGRGSRSCSIDVTVPLTQVTGTASFLAGTSGDLSNSKVSLYTSWDNWNTNQPVLFGATTGAGANVTFALQANPGNYYLDIWKDIDNSSTWTSGDYVGWYGSGGLGSPVLTEFQLSDGQTIPLTVRMWIIAKGAEIGRGK